MSAYVPIPGTFAAPAFASPPQASHGYAQQPASPVRCMPGVASAAFGGMPRPMQAAPQASRMGATAAQGAADTITVACLGDSLTMWGYPPELQKILDEDHRVKNMAAKWKVLDFGKGGAGIGNATTLPYAQLPEFQKAMACSPDIAIVMLGTNDAKALVWDMGGREQGFLQGYATLLRSLIGSKTPPPTVILVAPPPIYQDGSMAIQQSVVNGVLPRIVPQLGASMGLQVIDAFTEFGGKTMDKATLFESDGVHLVKPDACIVLANLLFPAVSRAAAAKVNAIGPRSGPPLPAPVAPAPPPPPPAPEPLVYLNGKQVTAQEAAASLAAASKPLNVNALMQQMTHRSAPMPQQKASQPQPPPTPISSKIASLQPHNGASVSVAVPNGVGYRRVH